MFDIRTLLRTISENALRHVLRMCPLKARGAKVFTDELTALYERSASGRHPEPGYYLEDLAEKALIILYCSRLGEDGHDAVKAATEKVMSVTDAAQSIDHIEHILGSKFHPEAPGVAVEFFEWAFKEVAPTAIHFARRIGSHVWLERDGWLTFEPATLLLVKTMESARRDFRLLDTAQYYMEKARMGGYSESETILRGVCKALEAVSENETALKELGAVFES